jgi:hypothetical protein
VFQLNAIFPGLIEGGDYVPTFLNVAQNLRCGECQGMDRDEAGSLKASSTAASK